MQQYLPFTVLKLKWGANKTGLSGVLVATVLTVYGIETIILFIEQCFDAFSVATVLTVYGIET